jgi:hypothetical protein
MAANIEIVAFERGVRPLLEIVYSLPPPSEKVILDF